MSLEHSDGESKIPPKLFRRIKQPQRPGEPLVVDENATVWEIYNHKAGDVDREFIKDWNDSLYTLLIFAALYSAVLTAFIIESMKLFREDATEVTKDILVAISRQLANQTIRAFDPPAFVAPMFAVRVNCLLFTSIICSLVTALCAVLALQWVANYDFGLNTSSPQNRAFQRQLRYMGIKKWKMGDIIASLPLLIFLSMFLFLVGLADWLWHINRLVSCIIIAGIAMGCFFYIAVTIIAIVWIDSPFRTPISKSLTVFCRDMIPWVKVLFYHFPARFFHVSRYGELRRLRLLAQEWQIAHNKVAWAPRTFAKCEEALVNGDKSIRLDSLLWLAKSIEVLPHSYNSLLVLVKEFMELPPELLLKQQKVESAPWEPIFLTLCEPYLHKRNIQDYTLEELENAGFLCKALSMIVTGEAGNPFAGFYSSLEKSGNKAISAFARLASSHRENYFYARERALVDLCHSVKSLPVHYFYVQLLKIRRESASFAPLSRQVIEPLTTACTSLSKLAQDTTRITDDHVQVLDLILDLITVPSRSTHPGVSPMERYSNVMRNDPESGIYYPFHYSFRRLLLHYIAYIDGSTTEGRCQLESLCIRLSDFNQLSFAIQFQPWSHTDLEYGTAHLLKAIPHTYLAEDALISLLRGTHTNGDEAEDRIMNTILGLENFIVHRADHSKENYTRMLELLIKRLNWWSPLLRSLNSTKTERLTQIKDAGMALVISSFFPNEMFPVLLDPFTKSWTNSHGEAIFKIWADSLGWIPLSIFRIPFVHACILSNDPFTRRLGVEFLMKSCRGKTSELDQHLLSSAILNVILRYYLENGSSLFHLVQRISHQPWFTTTFSAACGEYWLSDVILYIHPTGFNNISHFLIDQITFSSNIQALRFWLKCSHMCLQSLGIRWAPENSHLTGENASNFLSSLRSVVTWSFKMSLNVRSNTPVQAERMDGSLTTPKQPPCWYCHWFNLECRTGPESKPQDFRFVSKLTQGHWEKMITDMKVIIMGTQLGGLGISSTDHSQRFSRDPDGVCSYVYHRRAM